MGRCNGSERRQVKYAAAMLTLIFNGSAHGHIPNNQRDDSSWNNNGTKQIRKHITASKPDLIFTPPHKTPRACG
jgi:hypothetical protein